MPRAYFETVNPATGAKIAKYGLASIDEATKKLRRAKTAYEKLWGKLSVRERAGYLPKLATSLRSRKREYAELITTEMGKPISQSLAEVEKSAWTAEVYAENAARWLGEELASTDAKLSYVAFEPLGVVLSVMPWNFPFWQVFRFAIPAIVAGNTSVLRHSNVCPGSSFAVERAFEEAGFPEGVFSSVITSHEVTAKMIGSDYVQGVSFTGSVEAGRSIGEMAAKNLKKFVLELGGSDPYIVLDDADAEKAATVGASARLICSGQSCIAAKRFIVTKRVAKRFSDAFVEEFGKKKLGDPMDPKTDVGPLATSGQLKALDLQVKEAVRGGARLSMGGRPEGGRGSFYQPTVLERVKRGMKVMREEVFGPVAPIYVAEDEEEAIEVANDSEFGLGSSLWTSSGDRARNLASRIESGMVFINDLVKSDPRMPFGGIKNSGIGRELSKYGLREFVNVKSVNIFGIEGVAASPSAVE